MIIPDIEFPTIKEYNIEPIDEMLLSLSQCGFLCASQYYLEGIEGALIDCYARESVVDLLNKAENLLPKGLRFKIYDAYRPIKVQQNLWNTYRNKIKDENPNLSEEEIDFKTSFFVSKPSYDIMKPSLHNTGGAIDLTIVTNDSYALNMGTAFDEFSNRAWTNHFETYEKESYYSEIRENRRLLYGVMTAVGFVNLPSEWWHYEYGTKFWSYFKNKPAIYTGIDWKE